MEKVFFLDARCEKCGKDFHIRYDLAADNRWVMTYGLKELPRGSHSNNSDSSVDISNSRTGPQYKCPWCGSKSYVRCGCGKITCYDGSGHSKCAYCGSYGEVRGGLTSVNASGFGSGQ